MHSFHALDESFSAVPKTVEIAVPLVLSQIIPTEQERAVELALNSAVAENLLFAVTANLVAVVVDAVMSPAEPERTAREAVPLENAILPVVSVPDATGGPPVVSVPDATGGQAHEDGHEVLRLRGGGESSSEEEDESSEEEDAVSDIEVTETFDEVTFGDGDESHQIYTNMSGIIITWNTCAEDTFKVFRDELADMFGVDPQAFYIAHYAKVHQRRVPRQGLAQWCMGQYQLPPPRWRKEGSATRFDDG